MKEAMPQDAKIQSEHKTSLPVDLKGVEHTTYYDTRLNNR